MNENIMIEPVAWRYKELGVWRLSIHKLYGECEPLYSKETVDKLLAEIEELKEAKDDHFGR